MKRRGMYLAYYLARGGNTVLAVVVGGAKWSFIP